MAPRKKPTRLNLWDFDDTLADSWSTTKELYLDYPDIDHKDWWHDENVSTHAAVRTPPILKSWVAMGETEGEHWILTGRVLEAVLVWLEENSGQVEIQRALKNLIDVVSTSGRKWKGEAEGTANRKAEFIAGICDDWEEIHLYDDKPENIAAVVELCPKVIPHLVREGDIIELDSFSGEWDGSPT